MTGTSLPGLLAPDAPDAAAALEVQIARLERRLERERTARLEAESIAEVGLRRLYDQQQRLEIMHALTVAANETDDPDALVPGLLERLCTFAGWPLGHAWALDAAGRLTSTGHWYGRDSFGALHAPLRAGLPAHDGLAEPLSSALHARTPVTTDTATRPALHALREAGLRTLLTVPVLAGSAAPLAVLEFYAPTATLADAAVELARHAALTLAQATERVHARRALAQSEAHYRGVFNQASDAIFIVRGETGQFVDANTAYQHLVGYTLDELRARTLLDLTPAPMEEIQRITDEARRRQHLHLGDRQHRHRDGYHVGLDVSVACLSDEDDALFLVVGRDVSARKRYEQGLIEARDRAESMARLKDAFMRNMSHEFRTPLAGILGCAQILHEEVEGELREFASMITQSGERLLQTLQGVLDLSHLEHDAEQMVVTDEDLRTAASDAHSRHAEAARQRGLRLVLDLPEAPVRARTDVHLLSRVLDRLLDNALRFTDEGHVTISVRQQAERAAIAVSDTGIGIGDAFLPQVFEPFTQERDSMTRQYEGCGVGLALAQRTATLLCGDLRVESTPGAGSCFTLALPAAA